MLSLALAVSGGLLVGALAAGGVSYYRHQKAALDAEVDALTKDAHADVDEGDALTLEPVNVRSSVLGLVKTWRRRAKERRLASKGYVKWYRLDSQLQTPTWVQPTRGDGRGVGKTEFNGDRYYFDKNAMVTDSRTGAWVAMHEVGDADPVNLRDPEYPGIPVDRVEELLNMEAEAEKPGFFENLDISGTTAFILITVVLFLVYAATQVL